MYDLMLIDVGALVGVAGFVATRLSAAAARRAHRALQLPPARTNGDGELPATAVRLDGMVIAEGEELLVAPCSGQPAVWFRVRLRQQLASGNGSSIWSIVADESDRLPFAVIDAAGRRIHVEPAEACAAANGGSLRELSPEASERLVSFLGGRDVNYMQATVYEEEVLRPGDRVVAAGVLHRRPAAPVATEYRDGPSTELVLRAPVGGEIVVGTVARLRRDAGTTYRAGRVATAVGAAAMAAGFLLRWLA